MKKYTEIQPDGKRAYQFVADTAYIRESGTKGEHKAAEYIMQEAENVAARPGWEAYVKTPRMEFFQCPDFQEIKAELVICQPYEKAYPVRAYLNGACTPEEGITAPFLFVGKGDDISLSQAKGAVVLVCDPVREPLIDKIKETGAAGFVTVCGTPLDQGEDRIPTQYRRKASDIPGASIHFTDAVEIVEKGASVCRLNILQKEIIRNSANVAVRILGSEFPEEIVTVTAHYDSVPEGPGAYDNMSGGAMVMEAFHYFAAHRPARTMEFIWFGSEEKGLVGSQNYVKTHGEEMKHHVLNLNVDLAGQLLGGNVLGVTADPTLCVSLKELMEENQLGVTIKNQVWASDSNTFAWRGVPALTLNRDGFGMHTRHDSVEYISPRALEEGAKTLCTAASWAANENVLSFRREIPEDMKRELENYFA